MIGSISYVTCYFVCFKQCPPAYYFHHFIDADSPLYDAHSPSGTIFDHVFALAGPDAPPRQKRNLPVGVNLTPAVMAEALPNIHQHIDRSLYAPFLMRATCVARESDASSGGGGSAGQAMCASCVFALPDVMPNCTLADCLERFEGGVVLVSHDQYFVSRVAKEVWVVEGNKVSKMESFEAYRSAQFAKLKK